MKKILLLAGLILLLTGCSTQIQNMKKADYKYYAKSENFSFVITPTYSDIYSSDNTNIGPVHVENGIMSIEGMKGVNVSKDSIADIGNLLSKIFNQEIETSVKKTDNDIKITGSYGRDFILTLDKKTLEPKTLYRMGENIIFYEKNDS